MFNFVKSALVQILCWLTAIGAAVLWAITTAVNSLLAAIAAAIAAIVALLPNMPPDVSWSGVATEVFGYANWVFPVGFLVTMLATLAGLWLAWQAVSIVLRWGKATS